MYTVGRLARKFGLSRSTLLYYERIGLLFPTGHAKGEYRHYSEADAERLANVCEYRKAGLALKDIGAVLDGRVGSGLVDLLENRLRELNEEMDLLRGQQRVLDRLLGHGDLPPDLPSMDKKTWVRLLKTAGFTEEDMQRWHSDFERTAPDKHERFLRMLNIPEAERKAIRAHAASLPVRVALNRVR